MGRPSSSFRRVPRALRTSLLLSTILAAIGIAMFFVLRAGRASIEARHERELAYTATSAGAAASQEIDRAVTSLTILAERELMLHVLDGDQDGFMARDLNRVLSSSPSFAWIECVSLSSVPEEPGRVVASTDYQRSKPGDQVAALKEVHALARDGHRALVRAASDGYLVTVPIILQFDTLELVGCLHAELRYHPLVSDAGTSLRRVVDRDNRVLCEAVAFDGPNWSARGIRTHRLAVAMPRGIPDPGWSIVVGRSNEALLAEAGLMERMVLTMGGVSAVVIAVLVLLFARSEADLNHRLEARANELEILNGQLSSSRSELARVSRLAGMSEVATNVLHNVGNALNSVGVSARLAAQSLAQQEVASLRELVDVVESDDDGLASTIKKHSRGAPFLAYLRHVALDFEALHGDVKSNLHDMQTALDRVESLMQTQRRFATGVKVYENSDLADLVEEALSVSDSALSAETDPIIQRRLVGPECASLCRYKVLEILVCLVNNARQALARARPAQPLLTLEVRMSRAEWLTLHVQDNGVGIAPENLARIFAQNAKEGASAFGLHDAANAAKELGGSLRAHSAGLGLGAIFELELPYHPVRAELTRAA